MGLRLRNELSGKLVALIFIFKHSNNLTKGLEDVDRDVLNLDSSDDLDQLDVVPLS